jgi:hypothetical protein
VTIKAIRMAMGQSSAMAADHLAYERDGAVLCPRAVDQATLRRIVHTLAGLPADQAGIRLFGFKSLHSYLDATGPLGALAAPILGGLCRPVRAILFNKTGNANWALGWHQDRVIAVAERIEVAGFGPWTRKHGALHVTPPFGILEQMITLRLHIDDVPLGNAPLLIAPVSHRLGRIAEADVPSVVQTCGVVACLAGAGDVWLYSTPILHASDASVETTRRRVLQVDFAACDLPGGLKWLGV